METFTAVEVLGDFYEHEFSVGVRCSDSFEVLLDKWEAFVVFACDKEHDDEVHFVAFVQEFLFVVFQKSDEVVRPAAEGDDEVDGYSALSEIE